jgi:hypothetical protein
MGKATRSVRRWIIIIGITISAVFLTVCIWLYDSGPFRSLSEDDQITLYSIDGRPANRDQPPAAEGFHRVPVLGKIEIQDIAQRRAIIDELRHAYRVRPSQSVRCFIPRHGIRVTRDGATTDFVICFQCYSFYGLANSGEKTHYTISDVAQPLLNKLLTDAGIALAPK